MAFRTISGAGFRRQSTLSPRANSPGKYRPQRGFTALSGLLDTMARGYFSASILSASGHVYNLIRGLSPYPGAYTELVKDDKIQQLKIYSAERIEGERYTAMLREAEMEAANPGDILSDGRTFLAIATSDGAVSVKELQVSGKKRMAVKDFLLGFRDAQSWKTTEGTSSKITGHHA